MARVDGHLPTGLITERADGIQSFLPQILTGFCRNALAIWDLEIPDIKSDLLCRFNFPTASLLAAECDSVRGHEAHACLKACSKLILSPQAVFVSKLSPF